MVFNSWQDKQFCPFSEGFRPAFEPAQGPYFMVPRVQ